MSPIANGVGRAIVSIEVMRGGRRASLVRLAALELRIALLDEGADRLLMILAEERHALEGHGEVEGVEEVRPDHLVDRMLRPANCERRQRQQAGCEGACRLQ